MDLHNFIEDYLEQDDPEIQWNIACRKEFNELISDKIKLEKVDRFYKHQQLFLRYIRQYDRIFNIQATGTGKSGTIINAAEFFKKNESNIKRVYILEPGTATKADFKNQIQKLSDPEEYINDKIRYSASKSSYNNNMTRLINEWYSIETYRTFNKKNYNDQMIIEEFSDCLFFFDEAHTIKDLKDDKGSEISENEKTEIYDFLWRVTHLAQRSKVIVATATPMINTPEDFVNLLNLLLPADFQLPYPSKNREDFYETLTVKQLEPYFRGKITFIKFSDSNIDISNEGKVLENVVHKIKVPYSNNNKGIIPVVKYIEDGRVLSKKQPKQEYNQVREIDVASQIKLVDLEMKDIQLETYTKTLSKRNKAFYNVELQTSTFVYPNGQYGRKGFEDYTFKDDLGQLQFKERFRDSKTREIIQGLYPAFINERDVEKSLENLRLMSSKYHFYIEKELEASKKKKPGNSFAYIEFDDASGASLLGMFFRVLGFKEYKSNFSPRDQATGKIVIEKEKRFIILSGPTKNVQEILNFYNSPENKHGEYIQILIASKLAKVGINVKNVRRGYILTPGWHESGMYQALSRFIRADSHDELYKELGEKVPVQIYRLNATIPEKARSIDTLLYLKSELKDIKIKRIMRIMKQCSFDAFLNYERNINLAEGIEDGSAAADYDKIDFKIFSALGPPNNDKRRGIALNQGPNPGDYIYNTYNLLYSDKCINRTKNIIKKIIREVKVISIEELKLLIPKVSEYIFNFSLESLISNEDLIPNESQTINYILKYSSDLLYLKRENYRDDNRISTENGLIYEESFPLLTKITELKKDVKVKTLEDFYSKYENLDEIELRNFYIQTQDYLLFKTLIEDSLIKLRDGKLLKINKIILKLFSNYILITQIPSSYLEAVREALRPDSGVGQGRKRSEDSKIGLTKLDLSKIKNIRGKEKIYAHFYKDTGQTSFAINSIFKTKQKTFRVLERGENFGEANPEEDYVFNYLVDIEYRKITEPLEKQRYYASIIYRGGQGDISEAEKDFFRIIDNSDANNRGKICRNYDIGKLISIFKYLDTEGKYKKLFEKKIKKPKLCGVLQKLFIEKGLVFTSL